MNKRSATWGQSLLYTFWSVIVFGLLYPLMIAILAHYLMPIQADGSLIRDKHGVIIGSSLSGQLFTKQGYFHSRPSAAGNGYDPTQSGGSNLGPTSNKLIETTRANVLHLRQENPQAPATIPADLASTSASGLDPEISPEAATFQLARVANATQLSGTQLRALIQLQTIQPELGFIGEPRVNVLKLNLAVQNLIFCTHLPRDCRTSVK